MSNRLLLLRRLSLHRPWANQSRLLFHHHELVTTEGSPIVPSRPPAGSAQPFSSLAPPVSAGWPGVVSPGQRRRATSTASVTAASFRSRTGVVAGTAATAAGDMSTTTTTKPASASAAPSSSRRLLGHKARVGAQAKELQDRIREEGHEEALPRREKKRAAKGKKNKKHRKYEGGHDDEYEDDDSDLRGAAAPVRSERSLADEYNEFTRGFDDDEAETEETTGAEGPTLPDVDRMRSRMMRVVSHLERSFRSIRGNEPTPEMFESIGVVAYGTPNTPLTSVAQVVIASPTLARLTCYDPENATAVADAVRDAGLNLNPRVEEGGEVVVPIPKVSAETRRALSRQIGKMAEAGRVRVRGVRKKAHDACRKGRDGKLEGISKDDAFRVEKEVDAATDEVIRVLNDVVEKKQESLMAV